MLNFKPLKKNILVELPNIEETTKAGIIKSEQQIKEEKDKQDSFVTVLAIGNNVEDIKVGDKVLIIGNIQIVTIDNKEYGIASELSVIGKRI